MPLAKDIAEYLEDQSLGTVGTNIFAGFMPDSPALCTAVYAYSGNPTDKVNKLFEQPGLQIKTRGSTYSAGWDRIYAVFEALHGLTNTTIENEVYYYIEATGSPMQMGKDAKDRSYFICNFIVTKGID